MPAPMPALMPVALTATVVWLGRVPDRDAALQSQAVERLSLLLSGPEGEAHGGDTRPSCSRVLNVYPKRGTVIANARQVSVVSEEELALIAAGMGLASLDPSLIGANMVVRGIPDFSHVPPASRLQAAGGATVVVDLANRPCVLPARPIEAAHPGHGQSFKTAAKGLRGIVGWVERAGEVRVGDALRLFVPGQRLWAGAESPGAGRLMEAAGLTG